MMLLPEFLNERYIILKSDIQKRLREFESVPESDYFYELCFCICTPQSKAKSAFIVQKKLQKKDFLNNPFNPSEILRMPENYIRFHNTKAVRLLMARDRNDDLLTLLSSNNNNHNKRLWIKNNILGMGMKEASHFLRNIGYKNLAILDRHILKHLVICGVLNEVPNVSTVKCYLEVESEFLNFAKKVNVPIDELDLLFWSYEAGMILK